MPVEIFPHMWPKSSEDDSIENEVQDILVFLLKNWRQTVINMAIGQLHTASFKLKLDNSKLVLTSTTALHLNENG